MCDHYGMTFAAIATGTVASITRRAADRLRAGHLWVYRSDMDRLTPGETPGGTLVSVVDSRGIPLGTALYSAESEIALRLVSRQPGLTRIGYLAELRERLLAALKLRESLVPEAFSRGGSSEAEAEAEAKAATNACRLFFSEADGLPGIIADRYAGIVVLRLLIQGTAQADVRHVLAEVLAEGVSLHRANVVLNWSSGLLLQAPSLAGPWTTNSATSPYTLSPAGTSQMFYRVLAQ